MVVFVSGVHIGISMSIEIEYISEYIRPVSQFFVCTGKSTPEIHCFTPKLMGKLFKIPKNIHQNVSLLSIYYPTINPLYTLIICPLFGLSRFSPPGHHAIFDLKAKERSTGGYRQQQLQRLSDEVTRCEWRCRRFP